MSEAARHTLSDSAQVDSAPGAEPRLVAQVMLATHSVLRGVMERLEAEGTYGKLSLAHVDYVYRLGEGGCSPGQLAEALGISKQACSRVLRELDEGRLIERRPNPADSRSTLLSLSERGRALIRDGRRAARGVLGEVEGAVGALLLDAMAEALADLCRALPAVAGPLPEGGRDRLVLLVPPLGRFARDRIGAELVAAGFTPMGDSAGHVFGLIAGGIGQIRDLAAILGVTRQAVALAAAELERLGHIERLADPDDARQLFLRLSPQGEALVAAGRRSELEIEAEIRSVLGEARFALLSEGMAGWYASVAGRYDPARVLRRRIQSLSEQLLADLGPAGARVLAQQLTNLARTRQ
ncbi:MarR family transcriptional regulator [Novosphingobium bradum]|uniref:MarR family transcriptional regulator n=1 Tax=Novosphingobium bradum TaxID=1737444 RepID=A0ABV7IL57_9SPHN